MSTELLTGQEVGDYRIEAPIGRGGMGAVYRAEDVRLGRKVALKLLAPELAEDQAFRERFLRESELAASIDHENIIPIYAAGEANGTLFIAMRYVDGADLSVLLELDGPLEPKRAGAIIAQVAHALDAAHARGLVHRDVKPANILTVPREGREHCYLTDFGLTKRTTSKTGLTGTGQFVGTVDYVAPEQIEGKPVNGRADVYSLGCVLFECLGGRAPYERDSQIAVLWAHMRDDPPSLRELRAELPGQVDEVIATAMAKAPNDRHPTATALADAFSAALSGVASATPSKVTPRSRLRRRLRRRSTLALAATLTLAAAFSLGVLVWALGTDRKSNV